MESERLLTPAPHGPYAVRSKQAAYLIVHKTAGKVWTQKLTEHALPCNTLYTLTLYSGIVRFS